MEFQFNVEISEQDYIDFNIFHTLRSPYGQKLIASLRLVIILIACLCTLVYILGHDYFEAILVAIFLTAYLLLLKPFLRHSIKFTMKNLKKKGKMGYSPKAFLKFGEDCIIETTPEQKMEFKYTGIERISIIDQKVIYIHLDNVRAFIVPVSCFESQEQYDSFLEFIKGKCANIDLY